MRKTLNIVGIGGSIAPPNPRLPAYIMPALSFGNDLLLTSSKNGTAEYNTESDEEKQRVHFNTEQKILLLEKFIKMFYPSQPISVEYTEETDEIELSTWISLWDKMENQLTSEEKTYILTILDRYNQSDTLGKAKAYTIRHAFWFKDISIGNSLNLDIYDKFQSIGGPPEKFFNIIKR